jgi:hypothetical protein
MQSVQAEARVRAEPFDAVILSVHDLLEGDEDEDEESEASAFRCARSVLGNDAY